MKTLPRFTAWVMASGAVLACNGDPSSAGIAGRVVIAISPQVLVASPVDSIELQVKDAGPLQVYGMRLTSADTNVRFDIKVMAGTVQFTARVLSNTDSVLYSGATTKEIREDVNITLAITPQTPILTVSPESLRIAVFDTAKFLVSNKGTGSTSWQGVVVPPLAPCPSKGALTAQVGAGVVAPGEVDTARFSRGSGADLSTTLCRIRFSSATGYVDVRVVAAP